MIILQYLSTYHHHHELDCYYNQKFQRVLGQNQFSSSPRVQFLTFFSIKKVPSPRSTIELSTFRSSIQVIIDASSEEILIISIMNNRLYIFTNGVFKYIILLSMLLDAATIFPFIDRSKTGFSPKQNCLQR